MDASDFKSTSVFPHLAENLWPWTVDPPFVDASLFWVLPHIAHAIPHHEPSNPDSHDGFVVHTITSLVSTLVTEFISLIYLRLARGTGAGIRCVGILRAFTK